SIGFQSVESARIEGSYGIRFLKWLWLELSAVTIPANAEATITAIKSLDVGCPAATGHRQTRVSAPPRVRGSLQSTPMKKNISEQITAKKADLKTKSEALEALIEKDELDAAEQEDKATLTEEVKALAADIDSLEALELATLSKARPVAGKSRDEAGRSRGATTPGGDATHEDSRIKNRPKGVGFAQAVICRAASLISGEPVSAIAKEHYGYDPRVAALARVLKAPVAGGSTITGDGAPWGGALAAAQTRTSEFTAWLRPQPSLGKCGQGSIPSLRTVPFNVRIGRQTSGGSGYWVGQQKQKPLTAFGFDAVTLNFAK